MAHQLGHKQITTTHPHYVKYKSVNNSKPSKLSMPRGKQLTKRM